MSHEAARAGTLPTGFRLWDLAMRWGWTVGDEARNREAEEGAWSPASGGES
ncbi:MAG: hypothetical protein LBT40_07495 [Deltaproteobacteria bacterium]|nr:hypothetical protein [Deltaproteobacteria bacterium]